MRMYEINNVNANQFQCNLKQIERSNEFKLEMGIALRFELTLTR